MIGPFETYVLTGAFAEDRPSLLIWEPPYTYQLNEGALRQLLGALRAGGAAVAGRCFDVRDNEASIEASDLQGALIFWTCGSETMTFAISSWAFA